MYLMHIQDLLLMPLNSVLSQMTIRRVQRDITSGKNSMQRKPSGNLSLTVQWYAECFILCPSWYLFLKHQASSSGSKMTCWCAFSLPHQAGMIRTDKDEYFIEPLERGKQMEEEKGRIHMVYRRSAVVQHPTDMLPDVHMEGTVPLCWLFTNLFQVTWAYGSFWKQ